MNQTATSLPRDQDVGRIVTPVLIENYDDIASAAAGTIPAESVRNAEVADALVDTGATLIGLPSSIIKTLGLRLERTANANTAGGVGALQVFSVVRITIQGRSCTSEVTGLPDGSPAVVGQVPLEILDLIPAPREHKLLPNPAHNNEWMIDMY